MTETAAISAPTCGGDKKKLTHAERNEMKRFYMKARYQQDPAFAAAKRADMLRRYHERVPAARWGKRGRLPKQTQEPAASAAAAILAGAALAAVAATPA
jgi:hypothetical protein